MGDWVIEERERPPRTLHDIRVYEYAENQRDFALRIGVNPATLNGWETGRSAPQFRLRHQVADMLALRVTQILWDVPARKKIQKKAQRGRTDNGMGRSRPQLSVG